MHKIITKQYTQLVPEYREVSRITHYLNPASETEYNTAAYYDYYDYDWYGQVLQEKRVSGGEVIKEKYYDYVRTCKSDYFNWEYIYYGYPIDLPDLCENEFAEQFTDDPYESGQLNTLLHGLGLATGIVVIQGIPTIENIDNDKKQETYFVIVHQILSNFNNLIVMAP